MSKAEGGTGTSTTSETYFAKVANEILHSAEQIVHRMEDGISVLFTGTTIPSTNEANTASADDATTTTSEEREDGFRRQMMMDHDENDIEFNDEDVEEIFKNHPLQGMAEHVLDGIMTNQATPQTPLEHIQAFRSAINWHEPFVISILVFQVLMFAATIYVSRRDRALTPRIMMMIIVAIIVKSSEHLNKLGNTYWTNFATQNYFDKQGIFVLIMICGPLLIDSFIMLVMYLREASTLLIQVKTKQLKQKMKKGGRKESERTTASKTAKDDKKKATGNGKKRRSKKEE